MKTSAYTVVFALALGLVCSLCLTAAGRLTGPYWEANRRAEEVRNILDVLRVPFDHKASAQDLVKAFEANVTEAQAADGGKRYEYKADGVVQSVAIPFAGPGLWGPIKGLLALEADGRTIRGVTFYEQEETPGLGGEIASEAFRSRFEGKRIVSPDGAPGIRIGRGGQADAPNAVDGISGATMTCDKVEAMLNKAIAAFAKEK